MTEPLVRATGLTKRFGDFTAVDNVDFAVAPGEVFGFLGPKGAGKSSTMKMIGAISPVTEGSLTVFGLDPDADGAKIRARLGSVPQENLLDTELTVFENLFIYGRYFDLPKSVIRERIDELLDFAHLEDRRNDLVDPLSGGMKRRLTIARALINQPDLILLDEPTTGLDPQARHVLWDRLYRLKQKGVTLIVTTHYMDEAEQLCDRLVVMDNGKIVAFACSLILNNGKIVAEGSPRDLIERFSTRDVIELRFPIDQQPAEADLAGLAKRVEMLPDRALLYTDNADTTLVNLTERPLPIESTIVRRSTLEDVFLRLTGRSLVD